MENIPRILPEGLGVEIKKRSWEVLPIFKLIQRVGEVAEEEMYRVFNMGIGLVVVVSADQASMINKALTSAGEKVYQIGRVVEGKRQIKLI